MVSTLLSSQRVILLAVLSFCAAQAVALPVHVTLDWPSNALGFTHPSVHIKAVQTAGPNAGDAPVEAEAESDSAVLNLSDGIWQVQASASGYWSQGAEVVVAHQVPASVRLVFWPGTSLRGAVVTAAGETLPDSIEVRLNAPSASDVETHSAGFHHAAGARFIARRASLPNRRRDVELSGTSGVVRHAVGGCGLCSAL